MKIHENDIIRRVANQDYTVVDGEVFMLSIKKGEYYRLNNVASYIWINLECPTRLKDLKNSISHSYSTTNNTEYEIEHFLSELQGLKLINIEPNTQ